MVTAAEAGSGQRKGVALTVSVALHVLLLLFLLLYKIITPIPPFPQSEGGGAGLELALGYTELGMGDNSTEERPAIPSASTQPMPPAPQTDPEALTNEAEEDAPALEPKATDKPKPEKPRTEQPRKPTKEEQEQAFRDKLNNAWTTNGTGSAGKGASNVPGNAGGPTGSPKGNGIGNGTGSFRGDGYSIDLAGRTIRVKPHISEKPDVGGKVVLDIWVGPDGKVKRAVQNMDRSTTVDQTLVKLATRAALSSTFYPDPKAREDQRGTMTFIFVLQ
jgi:outer membrane biosynthesis protein TonB